MPPANSNDSGVFQVPAAATDAQTVRLAPPENHAEPEQPAVGQPTTPQPAQSSDAVAKPTPLPQTLQQPAAGDSEHGLTLGPARGAAEIRIPAFAPAKTAAPP